MIHKKKIKLANCPVCGSRNNFILYKSNLKEKNGYNQFLTEKILDNLEVSSNLRLCINCLLCFFDYRYSDNELNKLYSIDYSKKRSIYIDGYSKSFNHIEESKKSRAFLIRKLIIHDHCMKFIKWKTKANILDFGGWHGMNIPDIATSTKKFVLDKSEHKINKGINKISNLDTKIKFDLIISTHVFEHLVDPLKDLKNLSKTLKKDGLIYLELPIDIVGLFRKPPMYEHINFFSRNSIKELANRANLEILYVKCHKYPYSYHETIAYIVVLRKSLIKKSE